ncbi:MAG: GntR family transcriptional regulator [Bacteroidia bacterium]|nr:GntR family transcriptional regulator [Bacteroidia bacterium]
MIEIGKVNTLTVSRETTAGYYLRDEENNEVLLPASFLKSQPKNREKLDVFIYSDSENRLIASTRKPIVVLNEFACLRVNAVTDMGAFMEWGLEKDLFVPFSEQKFPMDANKYYVVRVFLDEVSNRIVGSSKLDKFLETEDIKLEGGQEVEIMIAEESSLGYTCIINGTYKGLIYHNDVYQDLFVGDELTAYVKMVREDKLIDISLQKGGFKNVLAATDVILEYLENHDGYLDLHDKSSPDEIASKFSMSKATFKKSIGVLYRHRKVLIKPDGVYLVKPEETESTEDLS